MAFRDLQHSLGKLTSEVRTQIARNNPLQNEETKNISMWIFQERNILAETKTLAYEHGEANKLLKTWATEEGADIEDIGDKLFQLLNKQTQIEQEFAAKYQKYRHALKSIRDKEASISDIREKKKALRARIAALQKSNLRSSKIKEFQHELESLVNDTRSQEAEIADFKRFALREAFYLRFNAMAEYAEKTALLAGFGKYIVDLVDIEPTAAGEERKPYTSGQQSAIILADALNAVNNWKPSHQDFRCTLAEGEGQVREDEIPQKESALHKDKSNDSTEASTSQADAPVTDEAKDTTEPVTEVDTNPTAESNIAPTVEAAPTETAKEVSSPAPEAPKPLAGSIVESRNSTEPPLHNEFSVNPIVESNMQSPVPVKNDILQPSTGSHTILQDSNKEEITDNSAMPGGPVHSPWQDHMAIPQTSPRPHHLKPYSTDLPDDGLPNYTSGNYGQLYRRVSHLRQSQRPYEDFQQQFVQARVGAGGFRIPVNDDPLPPYSPGAQRQQFNDEKRG
ncbi:Eisosome component PIL1-domain-containing protein [Umbelopsis sp. PMI_123]|nr:Eisosome component PIL1-domain-containing protein [Umbelopsis sp. PMI_123]